MALHEFLDAHRDEILEMTRAQIARQIHKKGTKEELADSLPELLDDVVAALRNDAGLPRRTEPTGPEKTATRHGLQRLQLGFTITELVHDYGAMCHAITTLAEKDGVIGALEYRTLNQVLDIAIAASVSEYSDQRMKESDREADDKANEHLGFVAHELRNAISAAILAFDAIRRGQVAIGGRTSNILERNLMRLRSLIDRSLTEVRLKSGLALSLERTTFKQLLDEVEASASVEAQSKSSRITVQADPTLEAVADRQMMISAIANLVQNAVKYSPNGAEIALRCSRSSEDGRTVTIEVEDECGGLAEGKIDELFSPFVRGTANTGGLGLGLAITRQAVEAHGGTIHVRNLPGKGCVFVLTMPKGSPDDGRSK